MTSIINLLSEFEEYLNNEKRSAPTTVQAYIKDLTQLGNLITKEIKEINLNDLRRFQREMGKKGLQNSTIERRFAAFSTFWKWLILQGYVTENPVERIQLPPRKRKIPKWLSEEELYIFANTRVVRKGDKWFSLRDELAWRTLAWLGLRRAEVLNLRIGDVHIDDEVIIVRKSKGNRDRVLMVPPKLKDLFTEVMGDRPKDAYVFAGSQGHQWGVQPFDQAFLRHLQACGLHMPGITPHTLRHSFATHMTRSGVPLPVVKAMLGHEDIKSTMIYIQIDQSDVRKAMNGYILNRM